MDDSNLSESDEPWETLPLASDTFKKAELMLLMKEREEAVARLVDLDYRIWVLEEHFRAACVPALRPTPETPVPRRSLSPLRRDPPT